MHRGNCLLAKNYSSDGAISAYRIIKAGSADGYVAQAAAATDYLMGVADLGCTAAGDRLDVHKAGIVPVEYGGTITRGAPLTADASGKAVAAAPAVGANVRIIGFAEVSGVSGDIGLVDLAIGLMQG